MFFRPLFCKRPRLPFARVNLRLGARVRAYSSQSSTKPVRSIGVVLAGAVTGWYGKEWLDSREGHQSTSATDSGSAINTARFTTAPRLDRVALTEFQYPPPPSEEQVTKILNKDAFSVKAGGAGGVFRYDGLRLPSNCPSEDQFLHGKFASPWKQGTDWWGWGVFDGHAGWEVGELLTHWLIPSVRQSLESIKPFPLGTSESDNTVVHAIKSAFLLLDDGIVKSAAEMLKGDHNFAERISRLAPSYSGSCALLSLYDPSSRTLRVACTGDSRAVLGQLSEEGKWEAKALSIDQTGSNEAEIARLNVEHPNEPNMVKGGRVHGIMVSRAFGDGLWKWTVEEIEEMQKKYNGRKMRPDYKTPPYLTAEPEVTTTQIPKNRRSFLIMASDGLWDIMSNEQAVDIVAEWLNWKEGGSNLKKKIDQRDDHLPEAFDLSQDDWKYKKERLTLQDSNAAVHLVRNGLGGKRHDIVSGKLVFGSPQSRHIRDDITVQVIFFEPETQN